MEDFRDFESLVEDCPDFELQVEDFQGLESLDKDFREYESSLVKGCSDFESQVKNFQEFEWLMTARVLSRGSRTFSAGVLSLLLGSRDSGLNRGYVLAANSSGPEEAISFPGAMVMVPDSLLFLRLVRPLLKSGSASHSIGLAGRSQPCW